MAGGSGKQAALDWGGEPAVQPARLATADPAAWPAKPDWVPVVDGFWKGQAGLGLRRFLAQRLREVQLRELVWLERGVTERVCAALARASAARTTA